MVILVQGRGGQNEDKELARGAYTVRFDPLSPERAQKWVLHRAGQMGLTLAPEAADIWCGRSEPIWGLASELAKLASLPADEPLTVERVGELVGVRHGETQWDWRRSGSGDQPWPGRWPATRGAGPARCLGSQAGHPCSAPRWSGSALPAASTTRERGGQPWRTRSSRPCSESPARARLEI